MKTSNYLIAICLWVTTINAYTQQSEMYAVTGIPSGDALNIRSGPGTNFKVVAKLSNGTADISIRGESVEDGSEIWVPISFSSGKGWVRQKFLVSTSQTSNTSKTPKFGIEDFRQFVKGREDLYKVKELSEIASPYLGEIIAFKSQHNKEEEKALSPTKSFGKVSAKTVTYNGKSYPFRLIVEAFVEDEIAVGEAELLAFTDEFMMIMKLEILGTDAAGGLGMKVMISRFTPPIDTEILKCLNPQ